MTIYVYMFHIASDRIFVIIFFILCHSNVAKVIAIYELNSSLVLFAVGVLRYQVECDVFVQC